MCNVSGDFLIFQHDSILRFLEQLTPAFISEDLWLRNSTDFNPIDYMIWGGIHQWLHQLQLHSIDEEFAGRLARQVKLVSDDALNEWRKHVWACVRAEGGHFEQLL